MMKLGFVSAILPDYTFEQVIDYAAEIGFECVEICCWPRGKAARRYAGVTHIDLDELSDEQAEYYLMYAKSKNIKISSLGYYPNPMDSDLEARKVAVKHILKLIDTASKLNIGMITTFIGKDKSKTIEDNLGLYEEIWTPIVKHAEKSNVKIAIENCPMYYTKNEWPGGNNLASTPYIWREMFSRIKSDNLGLNYDPSHPFLLNMNVVKPLYEFKDKIFHVHFKDIKIYEDKLNEHGVFSYPALWHSPKLPGLGGVNLAEFCSALGDIGYMGYACIEVEDKAFEGSIEDVRHGIEQSYRYMKTII